jgi:hypothetical protein
VRRLEDQRIQLHPRIRGALFQRLRQEAFDRGMNPSAFAAVIIEKWFERNLTGGDTETSD